MKRILRHFLGILAISAVASSAQAVPISTAIGLSLDGSGSISSSNFALQRDGYANVLGNASILPADGSVVLYINQFSSSVQTEAVARRISSEVDRTALLNDINAISQLGSTTNIGGGIQDAATSLDAFLGTFGIADFASDFRALIDVSTDGFANTRPSATQSAADAVAGTGLSNVVFDQVNCLGVGSGANCGFIPAGSFQVSASSFADFQTTLEEKLNRELGNNGNNNDVPEPSSLVLLALGLICIAAASRRRRQV